MAKNENEETTARQIASRIRTARLLANETQEDVARALGMTVRTYARWESAESLAFMGHLDELAEAFGTSRAALLGDDEGDQDARMRAMESELRELRELLLNPDRLRAAADALAAEAPSRRRAPRKK